MGLIANNMANGFSGRVFGLAKASFAAGMFSIIDNARVFGQITSVPQGMNGQSALRMTVKTGGNISARFQADLDLDAAVSATGNMSAAAEGEFDMIAEANVGLNGYASMDGEFDMIGDASGIGSMAANMDLLARPSANDIAQEVWNSKSIAFQGTGTLGKSVSNAESAAKLGAALSA